ncbi:MAG: hypothetical protein B7Z58_07085 [Acidiphilium sp. 37-64-53]|nr:MAG: hypothetical protein B7Z58_07085 [Acidiphilium sp. 37-64-53]OZB29908.1 MAG: hypothetical protein B7X49_05330 [Acidiphilium sp. 34-64-41]
MAIRISDTLRFTRVKIHNWMNFRDAEVHLLSRAFFVGPNAAGKSNFLDVFRFLADITRPAGGGLQAAISSRRGMTGVRSLHGRRPSDVEIEVDIGSDNDPSAWRYCLAFNRRGPRNLPTVAREEIWRHGACIEKRAIKEDVEAMSQTLLEQTAANQQFRALAEFLRTCRYLHVVPQIVRDRRRALERGDDPYGGDLLRRMKDMPKKRRDPRLRRVAEALRIAAPQFRDLKLEDDKDGVPHLWAAFSHWRGKMANQNEEAFSDGTLRLIGLLWSIGEGGGPLLLEEPELSLNDAVVGQIPPMFARMQRLSGRQVLATTHAAALLDVNVGLKEVHLIEVDENGSKITTIYDDPAIRSQSEHGMSISQAVLPRLRPADIESLSGMNVAA